MQYKEQMLFLLYNSCCGFVVYGSNCLQLTLSSPSKAFVGKPLDLATQNLNR